MKTQLQMFYEEQRKIAAADEAFMTMIKDEVRPLTNQELERLIARFPQRWGRYSGFVGKLKDEEPAT